MSSTIATPITMPRLGTGPAAEGRKAALRSFHAAAFTLDGDLDRDMARVANGTAPDAFKAAFIDTLHSLAAVMGEQD